MTPSLGLTYIIMIQTRIINYVDYISKPFKGLYCHLWWHKQDWENINKFDRNYPGYVYMYMYLQSMISFVLLIQIIFYCINTILHMKLYHASYKMYFVKCLYTPIKLYNSILYSILKTSVPKLVLSTHCMFTLVYVDTYMIFFYIIQGK